MNEPTLADDALGTETQVEDTAPLNGEASPVATVEEAASDVDMEALLETIEYIRPALQADGGDLVLLGVDGGTINLQMVGACGGCPMSMMTLKAGIERIMFDRVAGVTEVNAV
ncbi:MAG: NifU family protein [Acidimicrobiia bacterium]